MLGVDPQSVAGAYLSWIAAGVAALLVFICVLTLRGAHRGGARPTPPVFVGLLAAMLGGALTWAFFDSASVRGKNAERSALELRAGQLLDQSLTPGSPLACLEPLASDTLQTACERLIFASPASVASAISYVAAEFTLLSDMKEYAKRGGTQIDAALQPLRHALEADPFGFLAYVLVNRNGCTSERCPALALLSDPGHVRTNIIAQTLPHYLDHYRDAWAKSAEQVAGVADPAAPGFADEAPGKRKVSVNIDFPSAASIPPISIMNPEPKAPTAAEPERKRSGAAQSDPVWTPARQPPPPPAPPK